MGDALKPRGAGAVMASRIEAPDSLDYFPTPPWATRAVLPFLRSLDPELPLRVAADPCCGALHMAAVLAEGFDVVIASDIFDYGVRELARTISGEAATGELIGPITADFLEVGQFDNRSNAPDWLIFNPPFKVAVAFVEKALAIATVGVAALVRTSWLEGSARHALFAKHPPALIVQYAERVPMTKGRWDPAASTATSYCWVIWLRETGGLRRDTRFAWIPPGQRKALSRPEDLRFAVQAEGELL